MPTTVPGNEEGEMGGSWVFLVRSGCCRCDLHLLSKNKEMQNYLGVVET